MRIAHHQGRACLVVDQHPDGTIGLADISVVSAGRFGPDPMSLFAQWEPFTRWARDIPLATTYRTSITELAAPVPHPIQVFGVGTNYIDHAGEVGQTATQQIFSKLPHPSSDRP